MDEALTYLRSFARRARVLEGKRRKRSRLEYEFALGAMWGLKKALEVLGHEEEAVTVIDEVLDDYYGNPVEELASRLVGPARGRF